MIHPARRPFPEGSGIFETIRTVNGTLAEYSRHMRRAVKSAQAMKISLPSEEEIRARIAEEILNRPHALGRLRVCFSNLGFVVTHDEYLELTEPGYITFSPHTSKADGEQHKTFPYDSHYEIVDEARKDGFDDAMIFNGGNFVTETGLSNIAFLFDNKWQTPPISAGILPGIMRAIAIERCGVEVRNIHISEIPDAKEVTLLSSLKIAQPVLQIGEHRLPIGSASEAFNAQMREKVEYFSVG